ncbi:hypothetical protein [Kribbella sp. NPDC004875]
MTPAPRPSDPATYEFFGEERRTGDVLVAVLGQALVGYVELRGSVSLHA